VKPCRGKQRAAVLMHSITSWITGRLAEALNVPIAVKSLLFRLTKHWRQRLAHYAAPSGVRGVKEK